MYQLETAKKNIIDYLKHLIRDPQQQKAKEYAFANLKKNTAFWLRDFRQKVLPVKFRESQQDYYGKKGIRLHLDDFLMKQMNLKNRRVYFTVSQKCEQLDQFCQDFPLVSKVHIKSDNTGSYHWDYSLKVLYNICKKKNINLIRYYKKPCCCKDQCDRESAPAKSLLRTFVDAGNDIITANDIYKGLNYGFPLNASVGVIEYDNSATILSS